MAYNDNNNINPLPTPENNNFSSIDLIPQFFRSDENKKFLQGTIDQLIKPGVAEKLNGYVGRLNSKSSSVDDIYISDVSPERTNYQLEPALVIKDDSDNVVFYKDYNDYINTLKILGANVENHSRLNSQEMYAWNPNLDWDKFVNFREYYWLPNGPTRVSVYGQSQEVASTVSVSLRNNDDNVSYVFSSSGYTNNPTLNLYRGQTYKFEIDTPGYPIAFALSRTFTPGVSLLLSGNKGLYTSGLYDAIDYEATRYDIGEYVTFPDSDTIISEDNGIKILAYNPQQDNNRLPGIYFVRNYTTNYSGKDAAFNITIGQDQTITNIEILDPGSNFKKGERITISDRYLGNNNASDIVITVSEISKSKNISTLYYDGIRKLDDNGDEVAVVYIEKGTIEFTIPLNAPNRLFYISQNDINTSGAINVYDIEENSYINIEEEILGKKYYTSANGVEFTNGLKVYFQGEVYPEKYAIDQWYIEGVGEEIKLINAKDLIIPAAYTENKLIPFDSDEFDELPFSNANSYAGTRDYIVCNRASIDKNSWSRYNKWFHKEIIIKSAEYNNQNVDIDESKRATRPIIEFEPGLKMFNSGVYAKKNIDLVDNYTDDVFSKIEGKLGYNIDGVDLLDGMRILFTADRDILVSGKIFEVQWVTFNGKQLIHLVETTDSHPNELECVLVTKGAEYGGKILHYYNSQWKVSQEKLTHNQPPRFDVYDNQGISFGNTSVFESSTFNGTTIFEYRKGSGENDSELGFPLSYRSIENSGDIIFNFSLLNDVFTYQTITDKITRKIDTGYLRKYNDNNTYNYVNGFSSKPVNSKQYVIKTEYITAKQVNEFKIDVFEKSALLTDLKVLVYVNKKFQIQNKHYRIVKINDVAIVNFYVNLKEGDFLELKAHSYANKTDKGYFEVPNNLERNPLNQNIVEFTLGEAIDHVSSMIDEITGFAGVYPGTSNLRDLGSLDHYGKRFVKHSGPINLPLYHLTNTKYNVVNALEYSRIEYSRFKRTFLSTAETLGFDGYTKQHVDRLIQEITKDKLKSQPFYFSDMIGHEAANRIEYKVLDHRINLYSLSDQFDLTTLSPKSVLVYLNSEQLTYGVDYTFTDDAFVSINAGQKEGDKLEIYEYQNTDGSFIPCTPTKLGLYPKYVPELILDDTYQSNETVMDIPYKVYGEIYKETIQPTVRGWFYPVFTSRSQAKSFDKDNGGEGNANILKINGLSTLLYTPETNTTLGGIDTVKYDILPLGVPMIRGHDGSFSRAFLDFRDNLLLELEKRIFNNIKVDYDSSLLKISDFVNLESKKNEFTLEEINNSLFKSFVKWLPNVDRDYTNHYFFDRTNQFTFNYVNATSFSGNTVPGYWRSIYEYGIGTDSPHTRPWEILGFTIKPVWWNEVYGPAPYTRDNLILWEDLSNGIIREPNKPIVVKTQYAKKDLLNFIPVDKFGKLLSPVNSGYVKNFTQRSSNQNFKFGDGAPVESAWKKSSDYPFAILSAYLLNKPAKVMGLGYDVSRIKRNLANQISYTETEKPIELSSVILPNTCDDDYRIQVSGFLNYIQDVIARDRITGCPEYRTNIRSITNQLGFKLAGFSDKKKLKLILDSRSPQQFNTGSSIFIPQENYKIFYNVSSPVDIALYSGVIIEKETSGYTIRGYNKETPYFEYFEPLVFENSVVISVGGIAEVYSAWAVDKAFYKGQVIQYNNRYYRALETFTSTNVFDESKVVFLPNLPIIGGKSATFYRYFNERESFKLPYGTKLRTSQDVITFLLGHAANLKYKGFTFNYVDTNGRLHNWEDVAKEFLFWTTQGWSEGTVITLSPSAYQVDYKRNYVVADDIFAQQYTYSLLSETGQPLEREFSSVYRIENEFGIRSVNTDHGIYNIAIPLVQKEHVVLIDNKTVFNDIIFEPETGYRQERLKVVGYRSDNWTGSLNIPGFVFDDVVITDWAQWKDYSIGAVVKYKQYYYIALANVSGSLNFNVNYWFKLKEKPQPELITNFDYRINQFADFYDVNTLGFDSDLQASAQHLVGYQPRSYLANIINDDISQFKFYQGFIQEKGTKNSLLKLFEPLGSADIENLEFYEEWAIQTGRYGTTDAISQVEYNLKKDKLLVSPQPIELTTVIPETNYENTYFILPHEVYDKPENYTHKPFPVTSTYTEFVKTGGYVNDEDVTYIANSKDDLAKGDVNLFGLGDYVWVTEKGDNSWAVYQHITTKLNVLQVSDEKEKTDKGYYLIELLVDNWVEDQVLPNDIIGIKGAQEFNLTGLYIVESVRLNKIKVRTGTSYVTNIKAFIERKFVLTKLRNMRITDLSKLNEISQQKIYNNQKVWIDNYTEDTWAVLTNNAVYQVLQTIHNPSNDSTFDNFSDVITASKDNSTVAISAPLDQQGIITVFKRKNERSNLVFSDTINVANRYMTIPDEAFENISMSMSPDGEYLVVGIPSASNVLTRYKGGFDKFTEYNKNDIVKHRESLWKARRNILPEVGQVQFTSFSEYAQIDLASEEDSTEIELILTGNPGFKNNEVDHILVRSPKEMFLGSKPGDNVTLEWLGQTYLNGTLDSIEPFNGEIPEITRDRLSGTHDIFEKVENIFIISNYLTLPEVGDIVFSEIANGQVCYVDVYLNDCIVYLNNVNGVFNSTGELLIGNSNLVGTYNEGIAYSLSDSTYGFWMIKFYKPTGEPIEYSNNNKFYDEGRGLVYVDFRVSDANRSVNRYHNIQTTAEEIGPFYAEKNRASFISQLSYYGNQNNIEQNYTSNKWVVRVGREYSSHILSNVFGPGHESNISINFRVYDYENRSVDLESHGFNYNITNKLLQVYDVWNGYIDFEYSNFDVNGDPYEIIVGDIIEDIQSTSDGINTAVVTTSSAKVEFYQRVGSKVRVYVKILTGTWRKLSNAYKVEINRKSRSAYDPSRITGTIQDFENDVVVGNNIIGDLIVFENETAFPVVQDPVIVDEEYYFFEETINFGISRTSSIPSGLNKDYVQVYNIQGDEYGQPGYENEGAIAVYRKVDQGYFKRQAVFVSQFRRANKYFGSKVKIVQKDNYYTLLVGSKGDNSENNSGNIEIFHHGFTDASKFKGIYIPISYLPGDIVVYRDEYYQAIKTTPDDVNTINDTLYWKNISWQSGVDFNFKGEFDTVGGYNIGSIVSYNNKLYKAKTNIGASTTFNTSVWEEISTHIDYLGYLPNFTNLALYNEDKLEYLSNLVQFGANFDISSDAEVLVVMSSYLVEEKSQIEISIYRLHDSKYELHQRILAPNNTDDWAYSVSLKPDGTKFAVGAPLSDVHSIDQGAVYIYSFNGTEFVQDQTLVSPKNEVSEKFGYSLSYSDENLAVTSINGDQHIPTTFDKFDSNGLENAVETTFDNKFTSFSNNIIDSGVVYIFESINNQLMYSEEYRYDNALYDFGGNVYANGNHVYIGLPLQSSGYGGDSGIVIDYRKPKARYAWNITRQINTPVDISKIKGVYVYNKRENRIVSYVDYIDIVQGKIAGIADQDITFKLSSDPAKYNTGNLADVLVDNKSFWAKEHVGQVWWDISNVRVEYPYQGSVTYQKNKWNTLLPGSSIDVYEWVESIYLPAKWDELADSVEGTTLGISGQSLYGNSKYSTLFTYDDISKTFKAMYYFWVKNKKTIPSVENRNLSAYSIANLIQRPRQQGYRFISFLGDNKFILNNFNNLITSDDLVLSIKYETSTVDVHQVHHQYQLIAEGLSSSKVSPDIEKKWFDSLIGFDENYRHVPDQSITVKNRYGIQNRPRQSMFINRFEALKQYIERVNIVLKTHLLIEDHDISSLFKKEELPIQLDGTFDVAVDTIEELEYISTNKISPAKLTPVVANGAIAKVLIADSGRGYKVAPKIEILGEGTGAEAVAEIDNLGKIVKVNVLSKGSYYGENTSISVRQFSALVRTDSTVFNKWSIYSWNRDESLWVRVSVQDYDVTLFWNYIDWYADGFNSYTIIDHLIDSTYELEIINDNIGDIIKVRSVGSGGWLLLKKISNSTASGITTKYQTIGRENGSIQFKDTLYDYTKNTIGFDNRSYDSYFYDNNPASELRIILNTIKNDLFVGDLEIEYNNLFFASIRYVLSEQHSADWLFKTSFVKATHNLGELKQLVNFKNESLNSYQEYVNEAKPYSTKVREFISKYTTIDPTLSVNTDFDSAPYYNSVEKRFIPNTSKIVNNTLVETSEILSTYPQKHWADNIGYSIVDIQIADSGSEYLYKPTVVIEGGGGYGATAEAFIGYGRITKIKVINQGYGYISAPRVVINGAQSTTGTPAIASAILGDSKVRTIDMAIKFDRVSGKYTYNDLLTEETFTGTGALTVFNLEWPMHIDLSKVKVFVNGVQQLRSRYTFKNVANLDKKEYIISIDPVNDENIKQLKSGYTREQGQIIFTNPPALDSTVEVQYYKSLSMLTAEDRIQFAYNPKNNMLGKDLAQLMVGVDYGGVEIQGMDFGELSGWDSQGWYTDLWDNYNDSLEDIRIIADGSTVIVDLMQSLENDELYNVYLNGIRIDDPNYSDNTSTNQNAIMDSIVGEGQTTLDLSDAGIIMYDGDELILRKITSDGSVILNPDNYDLALVGGDLKYSTAKGIRAEEIIVDGDDFVSPISSGGPEELVPGRVNDALTITVMSKGTPGQGKIYVHHYQITNNVDTFSLEINPGSKDSIFVRIDDHILQEDEYSINWVENTITILNPVVGDYVDILVTELTTQNAIYSQSFVNTSNLKVITTDIEFNDNIDSIVVSNGEVIEHLLIQDDNGKINIEIGSAENDKFIYYVLFNGKNPINYSQVTKDSFTVINNETSFELNKTPFYSKPLYYNILVKHNDTILSSGYNAKYIIKNNNRVFSLQPFQNPININISGSLQVYLNGVSITAWNYDPSVSALILSKDYGRDGDVIEIYHTLDSEYSIEGNTVTLSKETAENDIVEIYQFSNHDLLDIDRISYDVISRETIILDPSDYVTYQRLTEGEIKLRSPAINAQYVWVVHNGTLLYPNVDYNLLPDKVTVRLVNKPVVGDDTLEVIHFSAEPVSEQISYMQFKDMLNRTHYKKVDKQFATVLAKPLNYYDLRIEVENGASLANPDKKRNLPGIIFINGERIEYFIKEDNMLRQLRRGTLGTGIPETHAALTEVVSYDFSKTIPYKDTMLTQNFKNVSSEQTQYELQFNVNNVNEVEVFVGGTRLRKNEIAKYDITKGLDSTEADIILPAEFSISNDLKTVILTNNPPEGVTVTVTKKIGQVWNLSGNVDNNTNLTIKQFLTR